MLFEGALLYASRKSFHGETGPRHVLSTASERCLSLQVIGKLEATARKPLADFKKVQPPNRLCDGRSETVKADAPACDELLACPTGSAVVTIATNMVGRLVFAAAGCS
jgi:hypothetical protein